MSGTGDLVGRLKARDVDLRPPAGSEQFERLERACSTLVGSDFRQVYSLFDGFVTHDPGCWMMLWSIDSIIKGRHDGRDELASGSWFSIGDFLLGSDIIVARVSDEHSSVRLLLEGRHLAPSIAHFVELIASGAFDWGKSAE